MNYLRGMSFFLLLLEVLLIGFCFLNYFGKRKIIIF